MERPEDGDSDLDHFKNTSVFKTFPLVERVVVEGRYLNRNISTTIENALRNAVEGVCTRHGFIKPGSVTIRSLGPGRVSTETGGKTSFGVDFDAEVANPVVGSIVACRILVVNTTAAFAVNAADDARVLEVIVPPSPKTFAHEIPFADLCAGTVVAIRIVGKRFDLGQKTIVCAGQLVSRIGSAHAEGAQVESPAVVEAESVLEPGHATTGPSKRPAEASVGNNDSVPQHAPSVRSDVGVENGDEGSAQDEEEDEDDAVASQPGSIEGEDEGEDDEGEEGEEGEDQDAYEEEDDEDQGEEGAGDVDNDNEETGEV